MICIDVEYRKWKWCPWKSRLRGWAPTKWHEMDERQYLAVAKAACGELDEQTYLAEIFGIPRRMVAYLSQWHVYMLTKQIRWIGSGKAEASRFFICKICGLQAPDNALGGMTLQQFMTVDTFFADYLLTVSDKNPYGDNDKLCRMVAALYMRSNEAYYVADNANKLMFKPRMKVVDIEGNAKMLEGKATRPELWGIFMNWTMIKNWLSKAYPLLFPRGDETDGREMPKKRGNVWLDIFDSFVGDDIAHMDAYRTMNCLDAFRIMHKRIKEAQKIQ